MLGTTTIRIGDASLSVDSVPDWAILAGAVLLGALIVVAAILYLLVRRRDGQILDRDAEIGRLDEDRRRLRHQIQDLTYHLAHVHGEGDPEEVLARAANVAPQLVREVSDQLVEAWRERQKVRA